MALRIEVSAGELIDKITILEIKRQRIAEAAKRANVEREYGVLALVLANEVPVSPDLTALQDELAAINRSLWQIEDDIRDHERRQDFGPTFIALARAVYHHNDRRSAVKRRINTLLNSELVEEKSYAPYEEQ